MISIKDNNLCYLTLNADNNDDKRPELFILQNSFTNRGVYSAANLCGLMMFNEERRGIYIEGYQSPQPFITSTRNKPDMIVEED